MQEFEKLGVFYLGRPHDLASNQAREGLILYESSDLVTHAVTVGMTGSGKTGLCIGLIEEAAIDGIPAIVIDPKGDLSNLLLTFPGLTAEEFRPWINEEEARARGVTPEKFAADEAAAWRKGLEAWGQDADRIRRLRDAAEFTIYTPGSAAGLPVSLLASFAAPGAEVREDAEALAEQVASTVAGLLALVGIAADPLKSREQILLATLLSAAWKQGRAVDLATLIEQVGNPPMARIGVLDVEAFYPAKERFGLAMALNNLLASPGFEAWMQGDPLDIDAILHAPSGKPRVAIFSIAHLGEAERMFFVSVLLTRMIGWMRGQSGTTSLRALLYMDEIFGYFPPVANPPSKGPLLTLLKQARAYGLGVVLATQNPVDLDYKGLSNAGTWFIGRLQTERDMMRVLDGLEGATAGAGPGLDRPAVQKMLAGLGKRIFLMHNVHDARPEIFQTRWTLSYLRGPLTREQIRALMAPVKAARAGASPKRAPRPEPADGELVASRPILPPGITQYFVPIGKSRPPRVSLVYHPMIAGSVQIRFIDKKAGIDVSSVGLWLTPVTSAPVPVAWDEASLATVTDAGLQTDPDGEGGRFAALAEKATKAGSYEAWAKDLAAWIVRTQKVALLRCAATGEVARPGESERDFRVRLGASARERQDAVKQRLAETYGLKIASLTERLRRAEQAVTREEQQKSAQTMQTAISFGATLLGSLMGRRRVTVGTVGRATTAARGVGRVLKESQDIDRAKENAGELAARIKQLESEFEAEAQSSLARVDPLTEPLETLSLAPLKKDVSVRLVALAWAPYWTAEDGRTEAAW